MYHPANRCHRSRGVLEDPLPLRKDQVGSQYHCSSFVALDQKREHHLYFIAVVLHIADVAQNHTYSDPAAPVHAAAVDRAWLLITIELEAG
jgi:hypothetical protein